MSSNPIAGPTQCLQINCQCLGVVHLGAGVDLTVLHEDIYAPPDEEVIVEDDEAEGEGEDIVTSPDLEELANSPLPKRSAQLRPVFSLQRLMYRISKAAHSQACWLAAPAMLEFHTPHPHAGRTATVGHGGWARPVQQLHRRRGTSQRAREHIGASFSRSDGGRRQEERGMNVSV